MFFYKRHGKIYGAGRKEIKTYVEDGITYNSEDSEVVPIEALTVTSLAECANEPPKEWLIDGVIAFKEDSTWWGPSGGLKSTLIAELGLHVAAGRDWRGHRFNRNEKPNKDPDLNPNEDEGRGVLIFATERASLTRRRLAAYMQRENLPANLPIGVVDASINLFDDANCVDQISDTVRGLPQTI